MTRTTLPAQHSAFEATLYVAFELGGTQWKLAASRGGTKITESSVAAGDVAGILRVLQAAKRRQGLPAEAPVRGCYEAGRDGFWLYRELVGAGVDMVVVDSSSIEVNRRARRAKTDRLDARKLLSMLYRYAMGERTVWHIVRVPTVAAEDARRRHRELDRLKKERTAHLSRLRSLLALHGVAYGLTPGQVMQAANLPGRDGAPLPPQLRAELARECERWALVEAQLRAVRAQPASTGEHAASLADQQIQQLTRLKGIAARSAGVLVYEIFSWRQLRNRREAGAIVGLTPTPYASDGSRREQGISKAGNRRVRGVLIQVAWTWLRHQPRSALSAWFQQRFGPASGRLRRVGIVALARRLFIALWRFVDGGLIPEGATLRAA